MAMTAIGSNAPRPARRDDLRFEMKTPRRGQPGMGVFAIFTICRRPLRGTADGAANRMATARRAAVDGFLAYCREVVAG
jgi:hypothetical protein